jgi:hypothetical protein
MCLDIVNAVYTKPLQAPRIAYKLFYRTLENLYFPVYTDSPVKLGKWISANTKKLLVGSINKKQYSSGFHCFETETDANCHWILSLSSLSLIPTVIQNISAIGIERCGNNNCSTLIAQKMYVPKSFKNFGEALEECHAEIARLKAAKKKHTNVKKESSKCIAQNAVTKISRKKTSTRPKKTSASGTTTASRVTGTSCAKTTGSKKLPEKRRK